MVFCQFYFKKTEQSEFTLRNSAVRYSIFCGSQFNSILAIKPADSIEIESSSYCVSIRFNMVVLPDSCRKLIGRTAIISANLL